MHAPIITVSGLRGIVGKTLTPEIAMRFTCAFTNSLSQGSVVLTRDGRSSGPMLADAIRSALAATGRACHYGDVASTPTCGRLVREFQAAGGIQVSASHNPPEYNGIKLFDSAGRVLPAGPAAEVLERYEHPEPIRWVAHDQVAVVQAIEDPLRGHLDAVLRCVQVPRIARCGFRILFDANHGAGGALGNQLLTALGCTISVLGAEADGRFAHPPEPTEAHLSSVIDRVRATDCDVAFCQDPDADRLAMIDGEGSYLGEECTLALCAEHLLQSRPGPVVSNCSSSRMVRDIAQRHGAPFYASAVGEAHVVDLMLQHDAILGGEGNGGVIDPRVGLVRDSFIAMALVLDLMAVRGQDLSRLAKALPRYEMVKAKADVDPDQVPEALDAVQRRFPDAAASRLDGLKLEWANRWLLVRPSNTEPIVRIVAEATTRDEAGALCRQAGEVLASVGAPRG